MKKEKKIELIYLLIVFIIMLFWSIKQPYDYGPDEYMRYKIPEYIYNHNKLPLPDNKEVIVSDFNASYAYYPTQLPAITSSIFMKITSLISDKTNILVIAARLTNVLSGTIFIYFMFKILTLLTTSKKIKWLGIILASLIPQFIFLSSYVNNDTMAIMASSIIVYAWIKGLKEEWKLKNSLLLAIGIIICSLSYYNAYAWILFSIIIFISSFFKKTKKKLTFNHKPFLKYGTIISLLVLSCISFFFIRNYIINDKDILGINSFLNACEEGGLDYLKPSLRETPEKLNMSYLEMLTTSYYGNHSWILSTYSSFIGNFGYMQYKLPMIIYLGYALIILIGFIGYLLKLKDIIKNKKDLIFHISIISCLIIPILLSLKYSYSTDYQPQGRYIYPMFTSFIIILTLGYEKLINILNLKLTNNNNKNKITNTIIISLILFIIISFIIATKIFVSSI